MNTTPARLAFAPNVHNQPGDVLQQIDSVLAVFNPGSLLTVAIELSVVDDGAQRRAIDQSDHVAGTDNTPRPWDRILKLFIFCFRT